MDEMLLVAAVLPAAVLLFYVYKKDSIESEPLGLIARMFLFGAIAGPIAAILESIAFEVFESMELEATLLLLLEYFIGVAAVEEGLKYFFLRRIRKNPEFNYVFDGVVYGAAVALGFATLENILYVFDGGMEVAIQRAIFSVPGHFADGVVMGCFFGLGRQREVRGDKSSATKMYWLAFLLPVIEHGFYDWGLSSDSDLMAFLALGVELLFIVVAIRLVQKVSKGDSAIYPPTPTPPNPFVH